MRSVSASAAAAAGRRSGGGTAGKGSSSTSSSSRRGGAPRPSSPSSKPDLRRPSSKSRPSTPEGRAFEAKKKPLPPPSSSAASVPAPKKAKKKPTPSAPPSPSPSPASSSSSPPVDTHKTFDEALITVRAGAGGRGEISQPGSGTWVRNFKFKAGDGKSSRQIFLPSADPARGGDGGSVVLRADPSVPDLLHLRYEYINNSNGNGSGGGNKGGDGSEALKFTARDGRQGDAAAGSNAPRAPGAAKRLEAAAAAAASSNSSGFESLSRGPDAPPLVLRVPLGTVVKRVKGGGGGANSSSGGSGSGSSGGSLVGELLAPGQTLVVAQGGRGGTGVVAPKKGAAAAARARAAAAEAKRLRRLSGDGGASFDAFAVAAAGSAGGENSADPNSSFLALEEEAEAFYEAGADEFLEDDDSWRLDAKGEPGEGPLKLRLLLRVVADVGLVGAPNAGKSSMLAALTRARPEVAAYPFTTLRPNLGVLAAPLPVVKGKKEKEEEEEEEEDEDSQEQQQRTTSFVFGGFEDEVEEEEEDEEEIAFEEDQVDIDEEFAFGGRRRAKGPLEKDPLKRGAAGAPRPVLADLPGLIEGAASGRGLGRAFLRHLRRARVILHVVDASTADPVADYAAIRKELALYNPEYLSRPHVVALNKADLFFSSSDKVDLGNSPPVPELAGQVRGAAEAVFEEAVLRRREKSDSEGEEEEEDEEGEEGEGGRPASPLTTLAASSAAEDEAAAAAAAKASLPHSVVWTSADSDLGLEDLRRALSSALAATAGQPAPGGARSSQRGARRARRAAAQAAFEASESRRGKDYAPEELEW